MNRKLINIFVAIFFVFIFIYPVSAKRAFPVFKDVPTWFKTECYDLHTKIDSSLFQKWISTYLTLNKADVLVIQNNKILPIKLSSQKDWLYSDYSFLSLWENSKTDLDFDYRNLKDWNKKTYLELTIWNENISWNEIVLEFNEEVKEYSTHFNFSFESSYYLSEFYISEDWKKYNRVSIKDITNFSFKYLKLKIVPKVWFTPGPNFIEKIRIEELSFIRDINTFVFISFFDSPIDFYSSYNCKDTFNVYPNSFNNFWTNSNTKSVDVYLTKNSSYNVYVKKDVDNDWVLDSDDNCKDIYNPFQKDIDSDWKWDMCNDVDKDWIIWYKDNCKYVGNSDQKDINVNWIGDKCEFDVDEDWIFDTIDNCRYDKNPNQRDIDKDWIWDICDNCNIYNPRQLDKNKSWIWDACDAKDKHLLENDDDKDGILNSIDNCKNEVNSDQRDDDNDWIWNSCDNCLRIQNNDQKDENKNNVWDLCEDSDADGVDWLLDNCLNVSNPDQKDSDNNGVWDLCEDQDNDNTIFVNDNCPYDYNPEQKDVDWDSIGDKCDDKDDRYIESNRNLFIGFMVIMTLFFFWWISLMLKKLGKSKVDES